MPAYENLVQAALGTARTRTIDRIRIQVTASRQAIQLTIHSNPWNGFVTFALAAKVAESSASCQGSELDCNLSARIYPAGTSAQKPLVSGGTRSMTLNPLYAECAHTGGARSRNTTQFILEGRACKGMRWESAHALRRAHGIYPLMGAFQRGCFVMEDRANVDPLY